MYKPQIYVAGRFGDHTIDQEEANRKSARTTALMLWRIGYKAICPHSMLGLPTPTEVEENDNLDIEREEVMRACLDVLSTCDCLFLMRNWSRSPGSLREYHYAQRLGMPILRDYDEAREYLERVHHARHRYLPKDTQSDA